MNLKIITGDLLTSNANFICHQVNATSNGVAGLAYHLFKKYPFANIYKHRTSPDSVGSNIISGDGSAKQRYIVNMLSQYYPGLPGPDNTIDSSQNRLSYFHQCLVDLVKFIKSEKNYNGKVITLAFPYLIGCGLAGGNWTDYLKLLEKFQKIHQGKIEVQIIQRLEDIIT